MFRSLTTLLLLSATAAAQDAPRVAVPLTPNASCPIMGKKVSLPLFVDTELGRIWVCCKPCYKKILANVPKAHQTAYPALTEHANAVCPVTGTPVGEHAETITLQGHRFRLCCSECATAARAHSQVTLARLLTPTLIDIGNSTCPVRGTPVVANSFVVVDGHIVHLADSKAIAEVELDPSALLQKAKQIAAAQPPKPPHVPKPKPPAAAPATPDHEGQGTAVKPSRRACHRLLPLLLTALAACSAAPELPDWPDSHPASPAADAAPEPAPSSTLTMPERKPRADRAGTPVRGH